MFGGHGSDEPSGGAVAVGREHLFGLVVADAVDESRDDVVGGIAWLARFGTTGAARRASMSSLRASNSGSSELTRQAGRRWSGDQLGAP